MRSTIVLKLTGTLFVNQKTQQLDRSYADALAQQIKQLEHAHTFAIVMGGGGLFRGAQHNTINLRTSIAHEIGICATVANSLALYDIFMQHEISCTLLSSLDGSFAGIPVTQQTVDQALAQHQVIIFTGGTGNPFVSTDTCAVIRAKQTGAQQMWKLSDIDGVYTADPKKDAHAQKITHLTYQEALDKKLAFMDHTALILAKQEHVMVRIFDGFAPNSLVMASKDKHYGTTINE